MEELNLKHYTKNRYLKFKNSRINKMLNVFAILLVEVTFMFVFLTIASVLFFTGSSMWSGPYNEIHSPISMYGYTQGTRSYKSVDINTEIYLDEYKDGKLLFRYKCTYDTANLEDICVTFSGGYDSVLYDQNPITDLDGFEAQKGVHEFIFYQSQKFYLDVYKKCKVLEVKIRSTNETLLSVEYSDYFKPVTDKDNQAVSRYLSLYTADSKGKFVPKIERTGIFKTMKILFYIDCVYLPLLLGKAIFLKVKIKKTLKDSDKLNFT